MLDESEIERRLAAAAERLKLTPEQAEELDRRSAAYVMRIQKTS